MHNEGCECETWLWLAAIIDMQALLAATLLLSTTSALRTPPHHAALSRREAAASVVAAVAASLLPTRPALARMSAEEMDALELKSLSNPGVLLPSGVRVIDVLEGTGPLPAKGDRVWTHFKVWSGGFRKGVPADSSFKDTRPYDWSLGTPDARMLVGADEGAQGMREGGWRRLVIPARLAYGEVGLPFGTRGAYLIKPNEDVYFELNMVDGGSGKCMSVLAPASVPEKGQRRLKSISCVRGAP